MKTSAWFAVAAGLVLPQVLAAQNSAYGVFGIGFPSAPFSVPSRGMGGGNSAVDPQSFLNPGALGAVRQLSVEAAAMQEFRHFSAGDISATGLEQNRFPFISVSAPLGPRFAYAVGFNQYAERTYDVATSDTLVLRGAPVGVTDRSASSGAVVEVHATVAVSPVPKWSMGVAAHLIGGSAKVRTQRTFADPTYRPFDETVDAAFRGFGVSAGLLARPSTAVQFGGSVRIDSRLTREIAGQQVGRVNLPVTVAGGFQLQPSPVVRVGATAAWRSWSGADADLAPVGTHAFNTLDAGLGADLGGAPGGPPVPVRLGVRYATLPFSPTTEQAHEIAFSAGTALGLASGRVRVDGAIERVMRDGAGVSERSWVVTIGFVVRP